MTVSVTLGLTWPLLALALERQGVAPWLNGLSAAAQMSAVLVVMPVAPALIGGLGLVRVIVFGIGGMVVCLALLPVFPNVWAWFPIRFALGLCEELVFIAADIWMEKEWVNPRPSLGQTQFPDGNYTGKILLTEESWHQAGAGAG